jgi:cytochrome c
MMRRHSAAVLAAFGAAFLVTCASWAVRPLFAGSSQGKEIFEKRCTGCHALDSDHEGPRLRGVFGRPAGTVRSFKYSEALQSAKFTWDEEKLDKWLTDTESVVPDNEMAFRVPKQEERAAVIAYLKSLSTP